MREYDYVYLAWLIVINNKEKLTDPGVLLPADTEPGLLSSYPAASMNNGDMLCMSVHRQDAPSRSPDHPHWGHSDSEVDAQAAAPLQLRVNFEWLRMIKG